MTIRSASQKDTEDCAIRLAAGLGRGDVILLQGALGVGKTVFARALIRALADDPALEVPSPTYTLVQTYDTLRGQVWHFDLYRLEQPEDVFELGWDDACAEGIVLVEWPERLGGLTLPKHRKIQIENAGGDARLIVIPAAEG